MTYLDQPGYVRRLPWLGAVGALHVALILALLNGLGTGLIPREPTRTIARIVPPALPLVPLPPVLQVPHVAPDLPVQGLTLPRITTEVPAAPEKLLPSGPVKAGTVIGPAVAPGVAAPGDGGFSPLHIIGGAAAPAYPESLEGADKAGRVTVDCVIQTSGAPTDCRIVAQQGGAEFANETLRWLHGPHHPVYQAAVRNGQKQAEEHQWMVLFQPE
jgi:protein TonB